MDRAFPAYGDRRRINLFLPNYFLFPSNSFFEFTSNLDLILEFKLEFIYLEILGAGIAAVHLYIPLKKLGIKVMKPGHKTFLLIDGIVNLVLGILLLLYPLGVAEIIGVPKPVSNFYPTILGGVIFGIGVALLLEAYGQKRRIRGLGLGGAIAINFCGAGILVLWLIFEPLNLPLRGMITLWIVAIVVLGLGIFETLTKTWRDD